MIRPYQIPTVCLFLMHSFAQLPTYLVWPAKFCVFVTLETWLHSIITNNVSQVDRLWTILPTIYSAYFALLPLWPHKTFLWLAPYIPQELNYAARDFSPRAALMLALTLIWTCRLSYNTWRRGLFRLSEEDYRWIVLRKKISPFLFQVTNLVFTSGIQNILLFALGLPTLTAVLQPHTPLAASDYLLAFTAIAILGIEFTADNQQHAYHAYKHAFIAQKENNNSKKYDPHQHWFGARLNWQPQDAERGFCANGLWKFTRHPNFACEQSFWIVITAFPILSPDPPSVPPLSSFGSGGLHLAHFGYHILPALSLCLLFWSSTIFTESITASKYPAYKAYQKRVAMFSPLSTLLLRIVRPLVFGEDGKELDRLIWNSEKRE